MTFGDGYPMLPRPEKPTIIILGFGRSHVVTIYPGLWIKNSRRYTVTNLSPFSQFTLNICDIISSPVILPSNYM